MDNPSTSRYEGPTDDSSTTATTCDSRRPSVDEAPISREAERKVSLKAHMESKNFFGYLVKEQELENCFVQFTQENGRDNATITWDRIHNLKFQSHIINPFLRDAVKFQTKNAYQQCICEGLSLNMEYKVQLNFTLGKNKDKKEIHFKFHTGPKLPRNFFLNGITLTWDKSEGAKRYIVEVSQPNSADEKHETIENKVKLRGNPKRNGRREIVSITAIGKAKHQRTKRVEKIFFGGDKAPRAVRAEKNADDPWRSIDVSWTEPEFGKPDTYKVKALTDGDKDQYKEVSTTSTNHTFHELMSNQNFYFVVTAVRGARDKKCAYSNIVHTDYRQRNEINIKELGKIRNFEMKCDASGDKVICKVMWKAPELGVESNNYTPLQTSAKMVDSVNQEAVMKASEESENRCSFCLEYGKSYDITVKTSYRDLDTLHEVAAEFKKTVTTEFEPPHDLQAMMVGERTKVTWKRAKGARTYRVRASTDLGDCEDSGATIPATETSYVIPQSRAFPAGRRFKIEVTSFDFAGNEKTATLEDVFLGTDDMPNDARISANSKDPNRTVDIQWKTPKASISTFKCTLYGSDDKVVDAKTTKGRKVTFCGLKQCTKYYGIVTSIRSSGQSGSSAPTNMCVTQSGINKVSSEEVQTHGKVRNLVTSIYTSHEGDMMCKLQWENPDMRRTEYDYIAKSMAVKCEAQPPNEKPSEFHGDIPFCDGGPYYYAIQLSPGRSHTVQVIATYIDRDDETECDATLIEQLHADITAPNFKIEQTTGLMKLTWGAVNGASSYDIQLLDANDGEEVFALNTKMTSQTIEVLDQLHYGRLCNFIVTAVAHGKRKTQSPSIQEIIGGQDLPHSLHLEKDPTNSRNLILTWKVTGTQTPEITKVYLYENSRAEPSYSAKPDGEFAKFQYVKSSTCYQAKLEVNVNGSRVECPSNEVTTDEAESDLILSDARQKDKEKQWELEINETNVKWTPFDFGKPYETTGYNVKMFEVDSFLHSINRGHEVLFDKNYSADEHNALLPDLKVNSKYEVTVKPAVKIIDKNETLNLLGKKIQLYGPMDDPILDESVKYEGDFAIFRWKRIPAAESFTLEIKDAHSHEKLLPPICIRNQSEIETTRIQMTEKLRVGRRTAVRLTARASNEKKRSTEWMPWTIGGKNVPVNIVAVKNCDNPRRCIDIRFRSPEDGTQPRKYRICACSPNGKSKEEYTDKTNFTFKRLRSNTEYYFKVFAIDKHGRDSNMASVSEKITTELSLRPTSTPESRPDSKVDSLEFENSVKNVKVEVINDSGSDYDIVELKWSPPSFSNNQENFYVHWYKWKILDIATEKAIEHGKSNSKDEKIAYSTEAISLPLGKSFRVEITAKYRDIDADTDIESKNDSEKFQTRDDDMPKKATISVNSRDQYRSVDVQWTRPKAEVTAFECVLYSSGDKLAAHPKQTKETRVKFDGLKQGTEYYGIVGSIKSDGQTGGSSKTNTCVTLSGKTKLSKEHVKTDCKVRDLLSRVYTSSQGDLKCSLRWKIPNTDRVKYDYILQSMVVTCKAHSKEEDTGWHKKSITIGDEADYESFVPLSPGKLHTIQVTAIYIDRDDETKHEAVATKEVRADIAAPEFEVKNGVGKTKISWKYVKGATSYEVQIFDANTKRKVLEDKTEKNWFTLPVDEKVHYGMLCEFVVASISSSEVKTKSRTIKQVIGGQNLPHTVQLRKDPKDSRGLLLNWKTIGTDAIEIAKVLLYEKGKQTPSKCLQHGDRSAQFRHLKSSTCYQAKVEVIVNGSHVECPSNEVTTERTNEPDPSLSLQSRQRIEKSWKVEATDTNIKWEPIDFGKPYKTTGYHLKVVEVRNLLGRVYDALAGRPTVLLDEIYLPDINSKAIPTMKANYEYQLTMKPKVMLIDKEEDLELNGKSRKLYGPIDTPILGKTTYDGNIAIFHWEPVPGADKFKLEIRDEFSNKPLMAPINIPNLSGTKMAKVEMTENLRVGRIAEVRLTATASKSEDKSTEWGLWIIGGDQVPRDVVVEKNCDNPRRCIDIRFKTPKNSSHLEKYRIAACPTNGKPKEEETDQTNFTFKRLISNKDYCVKVFAIYEDGKESIASISDTITTDASLSTGTQSPLMDWTGSSGANVSMYNTSFSMEHKVEQRHVDDRIQNIGFLNVDVSGPEVDIVKWTWSSPSFSIDPENFHVRWYEWKIMNASTKNVVDAGKTYPDEEKSKVNSSKDMSLPLGNSYQFEVKACYEDIDREDTRTESEPQSWKYTTRPCRPKNVTCRCDEADGKLTVKWNTAEGAERYKIEIFNDEDRLLKDAIKENTCTSWEIEHLYEEIGYGVRCYAKVTAIGSGKEHSDRSEPITVGGDAVPRSLRAERDPDLPNAAIVSWLSPIQTPNGGYLVEVFHAASSSSDNEPVNTLCDIKECNVRVKDLEPGTEYIFKVFSFHAGKKSVGCKTNEIHTIAGPGKLRNIRAKPCERCPSAAIVVEWEEEDKCEEYKIIVIDKKRDIVRTMYTADTNCYVDGLSPRTEYKCTVAGGTGDKRGFGNDSDPSPATTGPRQPTHVELRHKKDKAGEYIKPQSSLELLFEETGEEDVSYVASLYEEEMPHTTKSSERSPILFENLTPNKRYHATVHVQYGENGDEGLAVKSLAVHTASRPPENVIAKPKEEDGVTLNIVDIKWKPPAGCNTHKITVRKANTEEVTLLVKGKSSCEYQCLDGTCDYSFSVQTQNQSAIFSEPGKSGSVQFAPFPIPEVKAKLSGDDKIEVEWAKPDNRAQSYRVTPISDGTHLEQLATSETHLEYMADKTVVRYRFQVVPLGEGGEKSVSTESKVVKMKPPNTELLSVTPYQTSPSSSMEIKWKNLMDSNIYYKLEIAQDITGEDGNEVFLVAISQTSHCIHECSMPGGKYCVRVQTIRGNAPGNWTKKVKCQLAPAAVKDVKAEIQETGTGKKGVISWPSLGPSISEYVIKAYSFVLLDEETQPSREFKHKDSSDCGNKITVLDPGFVIPGKFYQYEVKAVNKGGVGLTGSSNHVFAGWEAPKQLSVTLDPQDPTRKALIKWTKPLSVHGFELTIRGGAKKIERKMALTGTTCLFDNGLPGETYQISLNWGLEGAFDPRTMEKVFRFPPAPPSSVFVSNKDNDNNGKPEISVTIDYNSDKPDYFIVRTMERSTGKIVTDTKCEEGSLVITEVEHGQVYIVVVQSVFREIEQYPSKEVASSPIQIHPGKIGTIDIKEENGLVIATWEKLEPDVDRYVVKWARGTENYQTTEVPETRFEILSKGLGEEIRILVAGENCGGIGAYPKNATRYTTVPSPPTNVRLEQSATEPETCIHVNYDDDARHPNKKYAIYVDGLMIGETHDRRYPVEGLTPGSASKISVCSIVGKKESSHCSANERGVTVPGIVTKMTPHKAEDADLGLVFKWDHPESIPPKYYKVQCGRYQEEIHEETTKDPMYRIPRPNPETVYRIRVAAVNTAGTGNWSKWGTSSTAPPPPRNVLATIKIGEYDSRYMEIHIDDSPNPNKEYFIMLKGGQGGEKLHRSRDRLVRIDGLDIDVPYTVAVYSKIGRARSEAVWAKPGSGIQ